MPLTVWKLKPSKNRIPPIPHPPLRFFYYCLYLDPLTLLITRIPPSPQIRLLGLPWPQSWCWIGQSLDCAPQKTSCCKMAAPHDAHPPDEQKLRISLTFNSCQKFTIIPPNSGRHARANTNDSHDINTEYRVSDSCSFKCLTWNGIHWIQTDSWLWCLSVNLKYNKHSINKKCQLTIHSLNLHKNINNWALLQH